MSIRVDLDKLKELTESIKDLEVEARGMRSKYGLMLSRIQELTNTLEGLSRHYGFSVELTPIELIGRDQETPNVGRFPFKSEEEASQIIDAWCGYDDKTPEMESELLKDLQLVNTDETE